MTDQNTSTSQPHVLIVEDDPDIASGLQRGLNGHGYASTWKDEVTSAMDQLRESSFDAAIVDVMIGSDNGLDLVKDARAAGFIKPIIVLSALDAVEDRTAGIEAGADDYIVKPFSLGELVARLKVQEKRAEMRMPPVPILNPDERTVMSALGPVLLTAREYQLLEMLTQSYGKPVSRGEIFDELWADDGSSSENVVDVYVGYLRKKLIPADAFPFEIKTIRNKGFMISEK